MRGFGFGLGRRKDVGRFLGRFFAGHRGARVCIFVEIAAVLRLVQ